MTFCGIFGYNDLELINGGRDKVMKKVLSLFLALVMAVSTACSVQIAFADDETVDLTAFETEYADVIDTIKTGLDNFKTSINIYSYGVTIDELKEIFIYIIYSGYEYYYVDNVHATCSYSSSDETIAVSFIPVYTMTEDEVEEAEELIAETLAPVVEEANELTTDVEKVLYLHNFVTEHLDYDTSTDDSVQLRNNLYYAVSSGVTMCVGYAHLYKYLLDAVGIESYVVVYEYAATSDEESDEDEVGLYAGHAWNMVCLDDEYYFVDTQSDDPYKSFKYHASILSGAWRYKYFLCSQSSYTVASNYSNYKVNGVEISSSDFATSTFYDESFLRTVEDKVVYCDGHWYYMESVNDGEGFEIHQVDFTSNTEWTDVVVRTVETSWDGVDTSGNDISIFYSNFQVIGTRLYYKTNEGIYYYDPDGESQDDDIKVFTNPTSYNLYDFVVNDDYTFTVLYGTDDVYYYADTAVTETYKNVLYFCQSPSHQYDSTYVEATCVDDAYTAYTCLACGDTYYVTEDGTATGIHDYEGVVTDATCTEAGYTTYTCTMCGDSYVSNYVSATGHSYKAVVTAATCVTGGYTTYTCSVCGDKYKSNYTSATGEHTYEWEIASNSYPTKTCSVCSDVKVTLAFTDISTETEYFDYIAYTSYYNSLITGVKANSTDTTTETFSPRTSLTRAMLVTILYRMAGSPYDDSNPYTETPFSDVKAGVWYYNAVCWALDNGITTETKFKPNTNVTREQTATFLYRYAGEYLGEDVSTDNDISSYPDASSVSSYAEEAMSWANAYGMITGTQQGYLNPQGTTLRVHATKILYGFGTAYNIGEFES